MASPLSRERGGVPPRSRYEVQLAGPMVGPIVHRVLPAAALDHDHGVTPLSSTPWCGGSVLTCTRTSAPFRADDGAANPGGYPCRYCGRQERSRTGQPAMTRTPPSQFFGADSPIPRQRIAQPRLIERASLLNFEALRHAHALNEWLPRITAASPPRDRGKRIQRPEQN